MPRLLTLPKLRSLLFCLAVLSASCSSSDSASDGAPASTDDTSASDSSAGTADTTTSSTAATSQAPSSTEGAAATGCDAVETGSSAYTHSEGAIDYRINLVVPTSFDGAPLPVVLNWHGLGSDGQQQALFSNYEALAEAEGFIVVHPTGRPSPGDDRNSWELPQFDVPDRDDVAFANNLIDELIADWCVDPDRVYSTGMSNGGFFTATLVCELSDRLAAAASVAGTTHPEGCAPSRPVPYLSFHGTADEVVPFAGGGASSLLDDAAPDGSGEFFEQVMPEEFSQFAADFNCAATPEVSEISAEVTRYDYVDCDNGVPLAFFEVTDGGHTWPGSPLGPTLVNVLGYTTPDVDATVLSWEFFKQFSLS